MRKIADPGFVVILVAIILNAALWCGFVGGLIYFTIWTLRHFGVI